MVSTMLCCYLNGHNLLLGNVSQLAGTLLQSFSFVMHIFFDV